MGGGEEEEKKKDKGAGNFLHTNCKAVTEKRKKESLRILSIYSRKWKRE